MIRKRQHGTSHDVPRATTSVRANRWFALAKRMLMAVSPKLSHTHLLVLRLRVQDHASTPGSDPQLCRRSERLKRMTANLDIRQIEREDDPDLDAVAAVDEWGASRPALIQRLRDGSRCFVAKCDGQIIAATWLTIDRLFFEPVLRQTFRFSAHESYSWASHCVPNRRGCGVMPRLIDFAMAEFSATHRKSEFLMLVRPSNRLSLRPSEKIGFSKVGCTGFVEIYGLRLNYIFGGNAFPETMNRIFLQRSY